MPQTHGSWRSLIFRKRKNTADDVKKVSDMKKQVAERFWFLHKYLEHSAKMDVEKEAAEIEESRNESKSAVREERMSDRVVIPKAGEGRIESVYFVGKATPFYEKHTTKEIADIFRNADPGVLERLET